MTATFVGGNVVADKCNMQLLSLHIHQWSIETLTLPGKQFYDEF